MELYNFFTEVVSSKEKINELKACLVELKPICLSVEMVCFKNRYSIVGQMYGDDTNVGDTSLVVIFSGIDYIWFDAFCPNINNIK